MQAARYYTVLDDGLVQPWAGRVWLNPPYAGHAPKFVARFGAAFGAGAVSQGVLLLGVHHLTTNWFAALDRYAYSICMPNGRLRFSGSDRQPAHGSAILGFGVDYEAFAAEFGHFGRVGVIRATAVGLADAVPLGEEQSAGRKPADDAARLRGSGANRAEAYSQGTSHDDPPL